MAKKTKEIELLQTTDVSKGDMLGSWEVISITPKTIKIQMVSEKDLGYKVGKPLTFRFDGTGFKRQGEYLGKQGETVKLEGGGKPPKADWIQKATKKMEEKGTVGAFTAKAKKRRLDSKEFARKVLKNPHYYDQETVDQARFVHNVTSDIKKDGGKVMEGRKILYQDDNVKLEHNTVSDTYSVRDAKTNEFVKGAYLKEGGEIEKNRLHTVEVMFENPEYNYSTVVAPTATEESSRKYFVGKKFNVASFPKEQMEEVVDIKFIQNPNTMEKGGKTKGWFCGELSFLNW